MFRFKYPFLNLFLAAFLAFSSLTLAQASATRTVNTPSGPIVGKIKNGVAVFRGIPYARAPIGSLRWHAPVAMESWTTPRTAFKDGAICLQPKTLGKPEAMGSEDCLNLNIWVPLDISNTKAPLPVMVYIHGGFYVIGSSDPTYIHFLRIQNGSALAARGKVIVVSIDYRLGALGFLAHPDLEDQTPESRSGNFGLMDQLAALRWIQTNIAAFGGDPSKVTLFGQSAGASSILTLIASPMSEGLFSQGIVQSGYLKDITREKALSLSAKLVKNAGCEKPATETVAECLRSLSGSQIIAAAPGSTSAADEEIFVPNQDGYLIPEPLDQAYAAGHFRSMPVILGTNSDETANLTSSLYGPAIKTEIELEKTLTTAYGTGLWDKAKSLYNQPSIGSPEERLIQFTTDGIFTCPVSTLARQMAAKAGKSEIKVWRYIFSHHLVFPFIPNNGAFHGLEIPYIFGSFPHIIPLAKAERDLSLQMQDYWTDFAKNGTPDNLGRATWANVTLENESALEFRNGDGGIFKTENYRAERCQALGL